VGLPGPGLKGLVPAGGPTLARTHRELGIEIERVLGEEVEPALDRIAWKEAARGPGVSTVLLPNPGAYLGFVVGGPVVVSLPLPGGWDSGPAGIPRYAGVAFSSEPGRRDLRACGSFLATRGDALRTFWAARRGADGDAAEPDLLAAVARRESEIRSFAPCRGIFPVAGPLDRSVRPTEGPP
jgi:hypothetical protein